MSGEVKKSVRCSALTKKGARCRRMTVCYPKTCGQRRPDLLLKKSTIRGLFAKRRFEDGETIGKYKGDTMSQRTFDRQVPESDYGLLFKKNVVIDAKNTQSCAARDARDDVKTNARFVKNFHPQKARVVATKAINRMKESFISSGPNYWR